MASSHLVSFVCICLTFVSYPLLIHLHLTIQKRPLCHCSDHCYFQAMVVLVKHWDPF